MALRHFTINAQGTKTEKFDRFPARKITRNNLKLTGRAGEGIINLLPDKSIFKKFNTPNRP